MLLRVVIAMLAVAALQAQGPGDLAAQLTGRWKLNAGLSEQSAGRGGRRGAPSFTFAAGVQRGARGGGGNVAEPAPQMPALTDAEAAAQQALSIILQVPQELTIEATAERITIIEPRGDSVFQIDGKRTTIEVPGATLKVRSRWDRSGLRQEFSSTQRVLHRTWSVEGGGRLLTLEQRVEGIGARVRETRTVFDRQ